MCIGISKVKPPRDFSTFVRAKLRHLIGSEVKANESAEALSNPSEESHEEFIYVGYPSLLPKPKELM